MKSQPSVEPHVSDPSRAPSDPQLQGIAPEQPTHRARIPEAELERFQQLLKREDLAANSADAAVVKQFKLMDGESDRQPARPQPPGEQRHSESNGLKPNGQTPATASFASGTTPPLNTEKDIQQNSAATASDQLPQATAPLHQAPAKPGQASVARQAPENPDQHLNQSPSVSDKSTAPSTTVSMQIKEIPVVVAQPELRSRDGATGAIHKEQRQGQLASEQPAPAAVQSNPPSAAAASTLKSDQPVAAAPAAVKSDQPVAAAPGSTATKQVSASEIADNAPQARETVRPSQQPLHADQWLQAQAHSGDNKQATPGPQADTKPEADSFHLRAAGGAHDKAPNRTHASTLNTEADWLQLQESPELADILTRLVDHVWSPTVGSLAQIDLQSAPKTALPVGESLNTSGSPSPRSAELTLNLAGHQPLAGSVAKFEAALAEPGNARMANIPAEAGKGTQDQASKLAPTMVESSQAVEQAAPEAARAPSAAASTLIEPSAEARPLNQEVTDLVNRLVDKMWVKGSEAALPPEVRLNLKSDVLPETQLRIVRTDNMLTVQFMTMSAASYQTLALGRPDLVSALQRRYGVDQVSVKVSLSGDKRHEDEESALENSLFSPLVSNHPPYSGA